MGLSASQAGEPVGEGLAEIGGRKPFLGALAADPGHALEPVRVLEQGADFSAEGLRVALGEDTGFGGDDGRHAAAFVSDRGGAAGQSFGVDDAEVFLFFRGSGENAGGVDEVGLVLGGNEAEQPAAVAEIGLDPLAQFAVADENGRREVGVFAAGGDDVLRSLGQGQGAGADDEALWKLVALDDIAGGAGTKFVEVDAAGQDQKTVFRNLDHVADQVVAHVVGGDQQTSGALDGVLDLRPDGVVVHALVAGFDAGAVEEQGVGLAGARGDVGGGDGAEIGVVAEDDIDLVDDRFEGGFVVGQVGHGFVERHRRDLFLGVTGRGQVLVDGPDRRAQFDVVVDGTAGTVADIRVHEMYLGAVRSQVGGLLPGDLATAPASVE